jgi:hypothetical protein
MSASLIPGMPDSNEIWCLASALDVVMPIPFLSLLVQ